MKLFKKLLNPGKPEREEPVDISFSGVENNMNNFKVAGVTYSNDDGESRQSIISKIKAGEKLAFRVTEFEDAPAIAIFTQENKQVGFVKKGNVNRTLKLINESYYPVVYKAKRSESTGNYYLVYKLVKE